MEDREARLVRLLFREGDHRQLRRTMRMQAPNRERRSSRRKWIAQVRLFLLLTAVMSAQLVSAANSAGIRRRSCSSDSFRAIELSSCKLPGVLQSARCGVLEVPENPARPTGRRMAVHVGGARLGMKYAAPIMMQQGSGSIINMASVNGTRAGYITLAYATAKAAVIHLTKCVAVELGPYRVCVNSLSPGPVVTGIFGKAHGIDADIADRDTEAAWAAVGDFASKVQPLRGIAKPDDIAKVALFLASEASSSLPHKTSSSTAGLRRAGLNPR